MPLRLLMTLLLSLTPLVASAQNLDSLQRAAVALPDDTTKVMALREVFRTLYARDQTQHLLEVADLGLDLSRRLRYQRGLELFIFYKASALDIAGRGAEAVPLFEEGLALARQTGNQKAVADYHVNLGTAHHNLGNQDKSLANFLAAYDIYKRNNQQEHLSKVLNNIAIAYRLQGKYERAEAIYNESLALKQSLKDTFGVAVASQNLAALYNITGRYAEAIDFLQKAIVIYKKTGQYDDVAGCQSLLGEIYYTTGNLPAAQNALNQALQGFGGKPNVEYSPTTYHLLGLIAMAQKEYGKAAKLLQKGLEIARQFGQRERIVDLLKALATTQQALGNHADAYAHLHEAFAIRDSLTEKSRLALLEEMQTKFDVAQKDNELKINQLSLQQRTTERNWSAAGAIFLGMLSTLIFFGFRQRIRANKKIAAQESALQQQQIIQLEQEAQLSTLQAMIEGQEQERSRIAADLHDGLGGLLTSVKSHFNTLPAPATAQELYGKTNRLIDDACGEIRRISHNMMPRALTVAGLSGALEDLVQDLEKQGIQCQLELIGLDSPMPPVTEVTLYRIIQELSNNVVRHARANHLLLQLVRRDNTLILLAEDDGAGFDLTAARTKKGLGLSSIESRVQFLQGQIEWDTAPGQGATVSITVPV